ncbi:MAG: dynamin family protein [Bacillus sp. (in: Bacteria)]|nr:dynamin family protein [Bacillus sp. (in: firmicutes)]
MVKISNRDKTIITLKNKISSIYDYLVEQNDEKNAEKLKQLAQKLEQREFMIAFCGHFSAGKSTMINRLVGENLLPASPIPTSANLVKVKSGEDYAKVFFKNEKPRLYLAPYNYELVKKYCKDGDQIEAIEISHRESGLPVNTVIMDTPGIDSADDAHRISTESALHLADLILYVMDYNHVQAELNFLFTRELTEAGKEFYLVINQVDKHKDEELTFHDYQNSVVDSFASWGVRPARIFYTSLKNEDNSFNEFNHLKGFITDKIASRDQFLVPSIDQSLRKIAQDHLKHTSQLAEDELESTMEILNELSIKERSELSVTYQEITNNLGTIKKGVEETDKEFDLQINKLLKNAYLMPFQTRALAQSYLEACQPDFKIGFLFSKQKTADEKKARLESFHQDILDKTKSQLEWHVRKLLLHTLKETGLDQGQLLSFAQSYSIDVPTDLLISTVKTGARLSGEYVLHYTEDVASGINRIAKIQLDEFKMSFLTSLKAETNKLLKQYEQEYSRTERYVNALALQKEYQQNAILKKARIEELLIEEVSLKDANYHLFAQVEEEFEVVKSELEKPSRQTHIYDSPSSKEVIELPDEDFKALPASDHLREIVNRLHNTSTLINDLPGFQALSKELGAQAERLENKGFTVALFGAFSAGKSSFANALMGEATLPVSPNPTTAAINKIKPVSEIHQHGTVLVKFKSAKAMLEDVNQSLKVFDLQAENFDEAFMKINKMVPKQGQESVLEMTHSTFLQAFNNGSSTFVKSLGTVLETDLTEFNEYVAHEEKSCFVEWIELYYDCELTRKGITLVDTPGADSINARHTNVAFDYIKNADACLFVTYYNHAFSKADREFLIQLGRVKESFQMDKMFFIINAIDLVEDENEKEMVAQYVQEQLSSYGINNPHLYSVSSLLALQEKNSRKSGMNSGLSNFEQVFYQYISNDLTEMAISSAETELERIHDLVAKLIQSSQEDRTIKEKKRLDIETQKELIKVLIEGQSVEHLETRLIQEADELVYYIKQRVFLRFGDFFKEAFNPTTLRDDGRNLKKALQGALDELLDSLGFDFAQEMRATTVRLERFAENLVAQYQFGLIRQLQEINQDLSFSTFELKFKGDVEFQAAFKHIPKQLFNKALVYFKNPRTFFEKNEKKLMSEEIYQVLNFPANQYLEYEADRLNGHYTNLVTKEFTRLLIQMNGQVDDFYLSHLSAIDG